MNCSPPTHCQSWKSGNENKLSTKIIFPASQCSQAKTRCIQVPGICTSIDEESEWTNSASFCWFCASAPLSVICIYDNHCMRLSERLPKKQSTKSRQTDRHPPLMLNKNLVVVDNIWLRMWWLSEYYRKNQCVFVGLRTITRMFPERWLLLLWINQQNIETEPASERLGTPEVWWAERSNYHGDSPALWAL